jgi:hypothetical protein
MSHTWKTTCWTMEEGFTTASHVILSTLALTLHLLQAPRPYTWLQLTAVLQVRNEDGTSGIESIPLAIAAW